MEFPEKTSRVTHGSVVIACHYLLYQHLKSPVLIGAGLIAKKAVEKGLHVKPYVKTSLSPGSRVATEYLRDAGLMPYLEAWVSTGWLWLYDLYRE